MPSESVSFEFEIPSIYNDTPLACRVFRPSSSLTRGGEVTRGAIIAHPYASLGGSYDDPIVNDIAEVMLEAGLMVCTFNFR